jgi:hypothetical protein
MDKRKQLQRSTYDFINGSPKFHLNNPPMTGASVATSLLIIQVDASTVDTGLGRSRGSIGNIFRGLDIEYCKQTGTHLSADFEGQIVGFRTG